MIARKLRVARAFIGLVRDPTELPLVFELADAAMDDVTMDAMLSNIRRHAQGASALAERPRLGLPQLDQLAALPRGTLGHAYAAHSRAAGLDPAGMIQRAASDEASYVLAHIYETHDIWHVITGFQTDVAGELGLMAFYAAQGPSKGPICILAAGLVNTLRGGMGDKNRRLDAIARGWLLGRHARPLFGVRWNQLWSTPLDKIRRALAVDLSRVDRFMEDDRDQDHSDHQQPPPHLPFLTA